MVKCIFMVALGCLYGWWLRGREEPTELEKMESKLDSDSSELVKDLKGGGI